MKTILLLAAALMLGSCGKSEEKQQPSAAGAKAPLPEVRLIDFQPGPMLPTNAQTKGYKDDDQSIGSGKTLFAAFNCNGCHFDGGGGIGPPLMDDKWIYGSQPENIFASIVEGRPNGMPSYGGKIPESQVWMLVAYVESLSRTQQ